MASRNASGEDLQDTGTPNTTVNHSPTRVETPWPRAILTIRSLTSAVSRCQIAKSSRSATQPRHSFDSPWVNLSQVFCDSGVEESGTRVQFPTPLRATCRTSQVGEFIEVRSSHGTWRTAAALELRDLTRTLRPAPWGYFGNKLGTVLATSAPCGHNAKTPRWRRASLGFADFKHHRNLFPTPR